MVSPPNTETHLHRRCRPEWSGSSSVCPRWSYWSRSGSTWTTRSSRSGRSPWSRARRKVQAPELWTTSTAFCPPALLDMKKTESRFVSNRKNQRESTVLYLLKKHLLRNEVVTTSRNLMQCRKMCR